MESEILTSPPRIENQEGCARRDVHVAMTAAVLRKNKSRLCWLGPKNLGRDVKETPALGSLDSIRDSVVWRER